MKQPIISLCFLLVSILSIFNVCKAKAVVVNGITYSHHLLKVGNGESMMSAFDFNSDGHQDIIVSNYSDNNIVVYEGDGTGSLVKMGYYSAGERPTDMSVSDVNNDGNIDVLIANHETSYLTLLYGDGKGGFKQAPHSPLILNVKPHPHVAKLKDLNGDNKIDLIVDSRTDNGLRVLLGIGNGQFNKKSQLIDVGGDPYLGFATGDINGDGKLDIVTPNQNDIGIALSSSKDKLSYSLKKLAPYQSPFAVDLVDMNGDGKKDLIVASQGSAITVIPGDAQGNFVEEKKTTVKAAVGAKLITTGDINGDAIQDAIVSNWSGDLTIILGGIKSLQTVHFKDSRIANPWGIVAADLNEDGKSDFIVASGDSQLASIYISQSSKK